MTGSEPSDLSEDRDRRFEVVIADYIRACESGTCPDRQEILQRHPEYADDLRQFFAQRDQMQRLAEPMRGFRDDLAQLVGPGQQVAYVGNYELLEEVARGGMGVVYKARQKILGRIVAVKMLLTGQLANDEDVQRFQIEAQAAANLQHPNIVPIHEVGQHHGLHYFSMDFVEGRSLAAILRDNPLPARQAATYLRQMAEGIHYAHQQGTLHRDLKPSNVMIDNRDQVHITDFGLAMRVEDKSDLTRTGQIVGTPSYMPPEQALARRSLIGTASDVYSLGAILYECLTGRAPFRADSVVKTIDQVIHTEAASPRLLNPGVPRDLETICLKCLEKEPHRRYPTAQLLADDLDHFLKGEPIAARPVGRPARFYRWCKRNPMIAALTSTAGALLLAMAIGTMVAYWREARLHARTETLSDQIRRADDNLSQLRADEELLRTEIAAAELELRQAQERAAHSEADFEELEAQRVKLASVLEIRQQKLYSTLLYLAQADWEAGEVIRADGYLEDCPENLRERRWKRLKHLCHPQMRSFSGTKCLAISADGRWLASVRERPTVASTVLPATGPVAADKTPAPPVAIQPRPSVRTGAETEIRFINKTAGEIKLIWIDLNNEQRSYRTIAPQQSHAQHTYAGHVWLVTDAKGRSLEIVEAIEGGRDAVIQDVVQATPVDPGPPHWEIVVWDFQTEQVVRVIPSRTAVHSLVFHPDNRTLLSSGNDTLIRFWDVLSGEPGPVLAEHSAPVTHLSLSRDGRRLASRSEQKLARAWEVKVDTFLWNLDTLTLERKRSGGAHLDPVGERFAYSTSEIYPPASKGSIRNVIRFEPWHVGDSVPSGITQLNGELRYGFRPYCFSPFGSLIAIAGQGLEVWNVAEQQRLLQVSVYGPCHVAFSQDGTRLAYSLHGNKQIPDRTADSVVIRNLHSGEIERLLPWYDSPITDIAFSPDGRSLATTDAHGVKVWDVTPTADPTEEILADIRQLKVGPRDWPQWGGSRSRVNTPAGERIPSSWNVGEVDPKTGKRQGSRNIKWAAQLGSQTYGNPVVANGRIFVGTNNAHGYLKRYPNKVDLGVLLCFKEETGEFLWQHSNEKLPTGRVHDWPLQGVCSTPAVDGDRLWYVTNRCEVVCLDVEGFADGEDDGVAQGVHPILFEATAKLAVPTGSATQDQHAIDEQTIRSLVTAMNLPGIQYVDLQKRPEANLWDVVEFHVESKTMRPVFRIGFEHDQLRVWKVTDGVVQQLLSAIPLDLVTDLDNGFANESVQLLLKARGFAIAPDSCVETLKPGQAWQLRATKNSGALLQLALRVIGSNLICEAALPDRTHEADVVWSLNMMRELGVFPHNMSNCSPLIVGDWLFVCTSNGVDESHVKIPAPDAPSFIALDRWTGKILWTDKSPGQNILHSQWASPSYGVFGGQPQVIFPGGDGWVYSFDPRGDGHGNSKLLWKFDGNFKESKYTLGGRATRNEIIAFPAIYDGLVYIVMGQDPEHGEGPGCLWCLDPALRIDGADVSESLAVDRQGHHIPHRRLQAVEPERGERAIPNPSSAVVWRYTSQDRDGDGVVEFEEQFHRSLSVPVIKDDILYVADFSGLFHCLNAKTGKAYWVYDMFAACWNSALIVDGKVFVGDEDGEMAIFRHSADPTKAMRVQGTVREPWFGEPSLINSIYMTPIVANNTLYVATKNMLFAIQELPDTTPPIELPDATRPLNVDASVE